MFNFTTLLGTFGLILILLALFLLETGRAPAKSKRYLLIGFGGSLLLTIYSWLIGSLIFVALNGVLASLNLYWLVKLHR